MRRKYYAAGRVVIQQVVSSDCGTSRLGKYIGHRELKQAHFQNRLRLPLGARSNLNATVNGYFPIRRFGARMGAREGDGSGASQPRAEVVPFRGVPRCQHRRSRVWYWPVLTPSRLGTGEGPLSDRISP